jgi:hypothetical protein
MYTVSGSSRTPVGATTTYTTSNPVTGSIAIGIGDTLVVALILNSGGAGRTGGAPTFGTYTMSQADTSRAGLTSPEITCEMWYITASGINQPSITDTDISLPNTNGGRTVIDLISAKTAPGKTSILQIATGSSVATTSTNPYCKITPTSGSNIIFEVVADGANTWAPTARSGTFTNINDNDIGNYGGGMMYSITDTTGTITGSWVFGTAEDWGIVMAAFGERSPFVYPNVSTHLIASEEVALTYHELYTLSLDSSSHLQTSDNIELTYNPPPQEYTLVLDSSTHPQTADNVVLTAYVPTYTLNIDSITQTQTSGNVTLTAYEPASNVIPDNTQHLQASDNVIISQHYVALTLSNPQHSQTAANITLTPYIPSWTLIVGSTTHSQTATSVNLIQGGAIGVQSPSHAQNTSALALSQHQILSANGTTHLQTSGTIALSQGISLTLVNNAIQAQSSDNVALLQHYILVVLIATQLISSTNISLGGGGAIPIKMMHYIRLRSK